MGNGIQPKRRLALLADDHALFRAGAAAMLTRRCGYDAVLQAGNLDEALAVLADVPDVSLACFDLGMPGVGDPASLRQIRDRFPAARLVVMTGSETRENILLALQSGAHGYVPKSLPMEEVVRALRIVSEGGIYVPRLLAQVELQHSASDEQHQSAWPRTSPPAESAPMAELTRRQDEILRLIRFGRSNKEIGLALGLAENTVKVHANALFRKLGVHTRQQAAALLHGRADRFEPPNSDTGGPDTTRHRTDDLDS